MAFTVTFDASKRVARINFFAPSNAEEVFEAVNSLMSIPGFQPGCRVLTDVRESGYTPDVGEIRRFADFHTNHPVLRDCPTAVVTRELVDYGMSNMFAILCQLKDAKVGGFRSIAEAEAWFQSLEYAYVI